MKILILVFLLFMIPNNTIAELENNTNSTITINEIKNTNIENSDKIRAIESKKISEATLGDLEKIISNTGINVAKSNYDATILNTTTALVGIGIGTILGFLGALGIETIKEKKAKNKIIKLLKNDLNRIIENIRICRKRCHEMVVNENKRKAFIKKVQSNSSYLKQLGASEEFNYWNAIMGSTYFITLNEKTIKHAQIAHDLVITYSDRIDHFVSGHEIKTMATKTISIRENLEEHFRSKDFETAETIFVKGCEDMIKMHDQVLEYLAEDLKIIG